MDHADLVAEMHTVENLPTQERLHLARMRRAQQLKVARQKEKEWQKMQNRRDKHHHNSHQHHHNQAHSNNKKFSRHISFESSVVLLEAAGRNDINEVAQLLQRGITPDAANEDGLTALHQCCIDNNVEMLKLLLDYGANVDAQDSDKWTPLHAAATCGHLNLVKILISHGANLLAVNTDGNMPYDLCDDEETLDYIEAEMSKRGVTQELIDETRALTERKMLNDLMELSNQGGDLEEPDHQSATPLHIAAANGYIRVVEYLLEHHVSADAVDKDLWTPVHAAACWGHLEVLEMLAQYGADLNARNKDDETPSDICEDPEIRERIEQLKTEQESKRLAEAQKRRVRRSQSNNTRAQSVRRTSLRDKTLTTKKDAVEETRLRLQAQEVFTLPDGTISTTPAATTNGSKLNPSSVIPNHNLHSSDYDTQRNSHSGRENDVNGIEREIPQGSIPINNNINSKNCGSNKHYGNGDKDNNGEINYSNNNNNNSQYLPVKNHQQINPCAGSGAQKDLIPSLNSRKPPDGGEDIEELSPRDKMIVGSNSMVNLHNFSASAGSGGSRSAEIFSTSKENGKINVQVTVLVDTHNLDSNLSGTTLANLKKQRSQSRTNALTENSSVISTSASTHHISSSNSSTINNNNNTVTGSGINNSVSTDGLQCGKPIEFSIISSKVNRSNSDNLLSIKSTDSSGLQQQQQISKFSGITGDVVSDSTSSKKCCRLM